MASFIARFIFAAVVLAWSGASRPVRNASVQEIQVVAKKFAFEPATIEVTAGQPVRLLIRSGDSVHGFSIRGLKVDVQVSPGEEPIAVEFTAPAPGRYEIACSEYCGSGHGHMKATLVSVAPAVVSR